MAKFKFVSNSTHAAAYNNAASTALKGGLTSYSGDQIQPRVKIGASTEATGSIIRAKGSRKFLVTDGATIQDEAIVANQMYMVSLVGTTDWKALGATANTVEVGHIFTAKASGAGLTTTGQVFKVGICTLVDKNNGALGADEMKIVCTTAGGPTFNAKRITNKYVMDFSDNKYIVGASATATTDPDTVAVAKA